tara:strand:- start:453 stop:1352 length:900 start_codon:yes stop_codon:yes gene_type:complete
MCTYNGGNFLEEQLLSIEKQTYQNWSLTVSDDGSSDNTIKILKDFKTKWGDNKLTIINGPQKGFSENFFSLIKKNKLVASYYAFADQDDIWEKEKIQISLNFLSKIKKGCTGLYCSRTRLINKKNDEIGYSTYFGKKPSFKNALVQSIAGGNTMVINCEAKKLIQIASTGSNVVTHDWLIYQIITGSDGFVLYDKWPSVRYRQHDNNKIGSNKNFYSRMIRIYLLFNGDFKKWINQNIFALDKIYNYLSNENKDVINQLYDLRSKSLIMRIFSIKKCVLYRQTFLGNIALIIGIILKRI